MSFFKTFTHLVEAISEDEQFDISELEDTNSPLHNHERKGVKYDLVELSINQAIETIIDGFQTHHSVLIYGDPGLGKSSIVITAAKQCAKITGNRELIVWDDLDSNQRRKIIDENLFKNYFIVWDIRTAMMEPTDIVGMIDIRDRSTWVEMKPQLYAYIMSLPDSAGILFLDELNQGQAQVQNALFRLVLDRTVGNLKANDNWGIVAAGNLGAEFNMPLPIALTSRFLAGVLVADSATWLKWARSNGVNEYICSFIESNPQDNFYHLPEKPDDAFPCPRSFVRFSKLMDQVYHKVKGGLYKGTDLNPMQEIEKYASLQCGPSWAARFMAFLRYSRHFDWDKIVAEPKKFVTLKKNEQDITNTATTDTLHGLLLYLTKQIEKRYAPGSNFDPAKTAAEIIAVINELDHEWRTILMRKLNVANKEASGKFAVAVLQNKAKEPFKSFAEKILPEIIRMSKGEV